MEKGCCQGNGSQPTGRRRRGCGLPDRDLRGPSPDDRQLALGRCAFLLENRKTSRQTVHGDRDPVPTAPFMLFRKTAVGPLQPNRLVLNIHPDEGITLSFLAKVPGGFMKLGPLTWRSSTRTTLEELRQQATSV